MGELHSLINKEVPKVTGYTLKLGGHINQFLYPAFFFVGVVVKEAGAFIRSHPFSQKKLLCFFRRDVNRLFIKID